MLKTVRDNVLLPLLGRLGTAAATLLVPLGVHADLAHQLGIGVTAAGLIIFDLTVSYLRKRNIVKDTAFGLVTGRLDIDARKRVVERPRNV